MSEENYIYLITLPNFVLKEENFDKVKGKVLRSLIILTGLKTWKSILEKWEGFSLHELIYLEYER
jgi:hypothetical protein